MSMGRIAPQPAQRETARLAGSIGVRGPNVSGFFAGRFSAGSRPESM
jgi:hypothetical protein